jgi:hypothetical protein
MDASERLETVTSRRQGAFTTASPSASFTSLTATLGSRVAPPILRKSDGRFRGNRFEFAKVKLFRFHDGFSFNPLSFSSQMPSQGEKGLLLCSLVQSPANLIQHRIFLPMNCVRSFLWTSYGSSLLLAWARR